MTHTFYIAILVDDLTEWKTQTQIETLKIMWIVQAYEGFYFAN